MIVLDTNVLSETMRPRPDIRVVAWLNNFPGNQMFVTAITKAEMSLGVALMPAGKRRDLLLAQFDSIFTDVFVRRCLPFDAEAATHYAQIMSARQKSGRPIGTEDAQIAAITRSRNYQLATRNVADFAGIKGLEIINPWVALQ